MKFKHLFALLVLLAIPVSALQDSSDDDGDDETPSGLAYLNLVYDKAGALTVDMTLPAQPQSWDNIALGLSEMLQCPVGIWHHPQISSTALKYFDKLPAARRQEQIQQFEQQYSLQLNGTCSS